MVNDNVVQDRGHGQLGTGDAAGRGSGGGGRPVAAIYARYSSKFQDSVEDQVRECRQWAEDHGYYVPDDLIFIDRAKSGRLRRRPGRLAMQAALEKGRFDVLVVFATSRLERNDYRIQQFVREEIVERGKRVVFINSGVDTDESGWHLKLTIHGIVDAQQAAAGRAHIQAAQGGMLLKGYVNGTITYGYRGDEVAGPKTRKDKPRRIYAVDPVTALWVKQIFNWYVHDRLSRGEIVRRLNEAKAPLPPRCGTDQWTDLAVKGILANARYRGLWQYGAREAVLLSGKDYVRQRPRPKALQEVQREDLRVVDDETWFKAQALRADNPHNAAGRKPVDGDRGSRPKLLNGLLQCGYHDRTLVVGGGNGGAYMCPKCKGNANGKLFTLLDRSLAMQMVCEKVAELVCGDEKLVEGIVAACRRAVEAGQRPDPAKIAELEGHRDKVTKHISSVLRMFTESDEDRRENEAQVAELRRQRAAIDAELARLRAAETASVCVPTPDEVRAQLCELARALKEGAGSEDAASIGRARRVIEEITGGKILIYQAGPREKYKGWVRGVFTARVVALAARGFGVCLSDQPAAEIEIEFRRPPVHEQIAEEVKKLWDEGLTYKQIAQRVKWNRNIVAKALAYWHESRGLPAPDGRHHIGRLKRQPCLAEQIADRVMEMVDRRVPIKDIAKQLGTSRNRVTEAIGIWHQHRNLPAPDGRGLRKLRRRRRAS
jgi:DNA invertase Pin-like site-specific DNA recombinase